MSVERLISSVLEAQDKKRFWQMTGERQYGLNLSDASPIENCPECKKSVSLSLLRRGSGESHPSTCGKCKTEIVVHDDY